MSKSPEPDYDFKRSVPTYYLLTKLLFLRDQKRNKITKKLSTTHPHTKQIHRCSFTSVLGNNYKDLSCGEYLKTSSHIFAVISERQILATKY
jgi:hypothetical protein